MTVQDWLDLMREAELPEQQWVVEGFGGSFLRIRNADGYCPLCALALATECILPGMRASYVFALRKTFGDDLELTAAHDIAGAADYRIYLGAPARHNIIRAALCDLLHIPQELA